MSTLLFSQDKYTFIDLILKGYLNDNSPGAALMVVEDGKIVYQKTTGFANLDERIEITSKTNFRLASVTKQFTAMAVLLLIEEGKLDYNTKLSAVFPGFPEYGDKISIYNLLTHTSGLIDYEELIPDTAAKQVHDADVLQMMVNVDSTYFEPGSKFQYSNTGYALLAMIIEKLSGTSFTNFLEKRIFKPLEMNSTVAHVEGVTKVENRAYGYEQTEEGYKLKDQSLTSAVLGDGGIYSNLEDLYKWDQSLYTSKLIDQKRIREATTRKKLSSGEEIDYGFGWRLKKLNGYEVVYHTGSTVGFRNIIYRIPDLKLTIILLTNLDKDGEMITRDYADKIASRLLKIE